MSAQEVQADDQYESQNDQVPQDAPAGDSMDNDYASRTGQSHIPVQKDDAPVGGADSSVDPNSDEQLNADESEAIDQGNVIKERTRGAAQPKGAYREPGDEEGLPSESGQSSM